MTTPTHFVSRPGIAASSYLNTAPLIWSFQDGTRREQVELITHAAPAKCAEMLARGEVAAALVPVIEYQRIPNVFIVPGVCVGSRLAVRSVVLVSKLDELKQIKSVALDNSSRTSQALVRIIFREFVGSEPTWLSSEPDIGRMLENNDAALIIGDPAMSIARSDVKIFDLASLWHQFTQTGFVFAMWMMRDEATASAAAIDFAGARDEGLEALERIIDAEKDVPLSPAEMRTYLTENITFHLDDNLSVGMQLYFKLAERHGLIEANKPLQFVRS